MDSTREPVVKISNLFCYSCHETFLTLEDFQSHICYNFSIFPDQGESDCMDIDIKEEFDSDWLNEDIQNNLKHVLQPPSTITTFFEERQSNSSKNETRPVVTQSSVSKIINTDRNPTLSTLSVNPRSDVMGPCRFLRCLEKADQIQIHCWICSTGFVSLKKFLNHLHHPSTALIITPPDIPHSHSSIPVTLEDHQNENNLSVEVDPLQEICSTVTIQPNDISAHKCQTCSKIFRNVKSLQNHTRLFHRGPSKVVQQQQQHGSQEIESNLYEENRDDPDFSDTNIAIDLDEDEEQESVNQSLPEKRTKNFKCTFPGCTRFFDRPFSLKCHTFTHTGQKPHVCPEPGCKKSYNQRGGLAVHQLSHRRERPFSCSESDCTKSFYTKKDLNRHSLTHLPEKPFKCTYVDEEKGKSCGRTFRDAGELRSHEKVHTGPPSFVCTVPNCSKSYYEVKNLREHMRNIHSRHAAQRLMNRRRVVIVSQDGENFNSEYTESSQQQQQERVVKRDKPDPRLKPRPFVCSHPGCEKSFTAQKDLDRHGTVHMKEKPFKCEFMLEETGQICGRTFRVASELKSHENVHTGQVIFECPYPNCSRNFRERHKLRNHLNRHPEDLVLDESSSINSVIMPRKFKVHPFHCPAEGCDKTFPTAYSLAIHKKRHDGVKDAICHLCGAAFSMVGSLKTHMESVHEKKKPYLCPHCGVAFFGLGTLKRHVTSHTGETPLKCQFCEESFRLKSELLKHRSSKHTGEDLRKFKCEVEGCDKSFFTKQAVKRHHIIHTGDKPFKCTLCPTAYPDVRPLKNHMLKFHPETLETAPDASDT